MDRGAPAPDKAGENRETGASPVRSRHCKRNAVRSASQETCLVIQLQGQIMPGPRGIGRTMGYGNSIPPVFDFDLCDFRGFLFL